jgi:1,4-alpha-glucan branching enzyme
MVAWLSALEVAGSGTTVAPRQSRLPQSIQSILPSGTSRAHARGVSDIPQLVLDDPWLESHAGAIRHRIDRFKATLSDIASRSGSLAAHATGHKLTGIHRQADGGWMVREWLPKAKAVSLVGDFNDWDRESHPLAPARGGVWQLHLPAGTLSHGQKVKLHITGADGSHRDRIPACILRAVQDPVTHDFSGQIWEPEEATTGGMTSIPLR